MIRPPVASYAALAATLAVQAAVSDALAEGLTINAETRSQLAALAERAAHPDYGVQPGQAARRR